MDIIVVDILVSFICIALLISPLNTVLHVVFNKVREVKQKSD